MQLKSLKLTQFKNYESQKLDLSTGLNCFVGPNGAGKTNLLEAIYFLCMGKSFSTSPDAYAIRHGDQGTRLEGQFTSGETGASDKIVVKVQKRKRKIIERNGTAYERLAEHVGRYPVVVITPDDTNLVLEGSELRRRLLDNSLSQSNPTYLNQLITYNKLLTNRNALLKELEGRKDPTGLLDVYDQQMAEPAAYLHEKRREFITPFTDILTDTYAVISGQQEEVGITYRSHLNDTTWAEVTQQRREKDRLLQRTTGGVHRDDLVFTQGGHPLRRVASQGQLKSFVLSLKLAQYRLLETNTGRTPILLLDDIFDKLDRDRVRQLLGLVLSAGFGQVFLSDTDPERVTALIEGGEETAWKRFLVRDGQVTAAAEEA
ncbi:DNA replication/repair protein RecF [Neolewinella antarctica]|uniref:DNA replication/repair protein RecF n=1 Tax=Neolewinella antarctica TaxID=442734 RepID=UPI00143874C1|nr:DNA replication/repair protein RecF [Neolewinella antarctica]